MEIVGAMTERIKHLPGNDDTAGEGDQPGIAQQLGRDGQKFVARHRAAKRQRRVMLPEQRGERVLLVRIAGEQNDRLQHGQPFVSPAEVNRGAP